MDDTRWRLLAAVVMTWLFGACCWYAGRDRERAALQQQWSDLHRKMALVTMALEAAEAYREEGEAEGGPLRLLERERSIVVPPDPI